MNRRCTTLALGAMLFLLVFVTATQTATATPAPTGDQTQGIVLDQTASSAATQFAYDNVNPGALAAFPNFSSANMTNYSAGENVALDTGPPAAIQQNENVATFDYYTFVVKNDRCPAASTASQNIKDTEVVRLWPGYPDAQSGATFAGQNAEYFYAVLVSLQEPQRIIRC